MNLGRAKTALIIMLIAANLALAGLLGWRVLSDGRLRAESQRQLASLLESRGVYADNLPPPDERVPPQILTRSPGAERVGALSVLGADAGSEEPGGGIALYSNAAGSVRFRAGGRFELSLQNPSSVSAASLLRDMGYAGLIASAERPGILGQTVLGRPVFNARAELAFDADNRLLSAEGILCLGDIAPESPKLCLSAGATLLRYAAVLNAGEELRVRDMQLGFRLNQLTPELSRLTPEWRVMLEDGTEIYIES
ncbi:hypothetical protein FACS18949_03640 [Clostridia bacterium]|nr:hypothetical protein FACS18949_03640 [Clostridia bacterium]